MERGELNNEVSSLASEIGSEHIDDELDDEEKEPRMSVKVLQKDQLHDVEYFLKILDLYSIYQSSSRLLEI